MATHKAIRDTLSAVTSLAFAEVERLAREVFREDPNCMNFCMSMGSASFYREWIDCNDPDGDWPMNEYLSAEEVYEMSGSQAAKRREKAMRNPATWKLSREAKRAVQWLKAAMNKRK